MSSADPGWTRRATQALACLGAFALFVALATPLVGLIVDNPEPVTAARPTVEADPHGATAEVRQLPLLPVGAVIRADLGDAAAVDAAIHGLAAELGLADQIDHLLGTYEYGADTYPYTYPVSDAVVGAQLDPEVVRANPDAVVELAGLLAVLGTTTADDYLAGPAAAATAYSLLSEARRVVETCDLALTLLYVVSLGDRARESAVDDEASRAERACGDHDAMPALVRAQWLSRHAAVVGLLAAPHVRPSQIRREARRAWLDVQRRFPASPWGFAGLADLDARWADQAEGVGAAPFQVLAWRREAVALYAAAASLEADPVLDVRAAEVRALAGEQDTAVAQASAAIRAVPDDLVARMGVSDVLAMSGDHAAAAESVTAELSLPAPWWLGRGPSTANNLYRDYAQPVVPQVFLLDASTGQYGGGFVSDFGFLPQHREEFARPECRRDVRVRELMLAGALADAAESLATPPATSAGLAGLCLGGATDAFVSTLGPALAVLDGTTDEPAAFELAQDFLRAAGDLAAAQEVAETWVDKNPDDGLAHQRLAEIHLLGRDYGAAEAELETALPLLQAAAASYDVSTATFEPNPVKDLCIAELQLGLALDKQGDGDAALPHYATASAVLVPLKAVREQSPETYPGDLDVYAHGQSGAALAAAGRNARAIDEYQLAIEAGTPYEPMAIWEAADTSFRPEAALGGALSGAQANNLALLLSLDGEHDEAIHQGRAAMTEDPASSVFTDTLAYAYQRAGEDDQAIAAYRRVVRADPTAYVSANNLGVLLAEAGQQGPADHWFRQAIATRPDYAQAWHNLGSLLAEQWSPKAYVASQAAFAEAVRLDSGFRDVEPGYAMDAQVRDLDLDVSRPLDPDWQFANSVDDTGTPFTLVLLLLLLWRVLWSLGLDTVIGRGAEGALARGGRLSYLAATLPGWAAALLCVALLSGSLLLSRRDWAGLVGALAIVGLVTVPLALRAGARHRSWVPAMGVGVALAPLGAPFVAYPHLVAVKERPTRFLLVLPAVVASGALAVFALESAFVGTPVAHTLTAVCAVFLASVLVPVPPLDGSRHRSRPLGVTAAVVLAGVTVGLALGWF